MDFYAKQALMYLQPTNLPPQQAFLLEPVCIFAELSKITADMGHHMRYHPQCCLAKDSFHHLGILHLQEFVKVDWEMVYQMLHEVTRLFQKWACKQVMGIAGTMEWNKSDVRKCPSCMREHDTCSHVLFCDHVG
jgi:hypothetical protein